MALLSRCDGKSQNLLKVRQINSLDKSLKINNGCSGKNKRWGVKIVHISIKDEMGKDLKRTFSRSVNHPEYIKIIVGKKFENWKKMQKNKAGSMRKKFEN